MAALKELDALEVLVIVDNELDPISKYIEPVQATGNLGHIGLGSPSAPKDRGEGVKELRMDEICCGAHGFSVMVVRLSLARHRCIEMPSHHYAESNEGRCYTDRFVRHRARGRHLGTECQALEARACFNRSYHALSLA
jgi:hypothetical protein